MKTVVLFSASVLARVSENTHFETSLESIKKIVF